jgi:hypothetical protein
VPPLSVEWRLRQPADEDSVGAPRPVAGDSRLGYHAE